MGNVSFIDGHIDEPKLTDNEIIKALELCIKDNGCAGCRFYDDAYPHCTKNLMIHTFDLINRLQADNAELKNINESLRGSVDFFKAYDVLSLKAEIENYKQIAENQQSVSMDKEVEIKRLKAEVERLQKENQLLLDKHPSNTHRNCVIIDNGIIYTKTLNDYDKFLTDVSSEAVKEVANILESRLEGKTAVFRYGYAVAIAEIKEMGCDSNV